MTAYSKEFLHSLHPVLADELGVIQNDRFEVRKIACCFLLEDRDDDRHVLKLNDSSLIIWQLCGQRRTVGEMVGLLCEAFDHEREPMARDVSRVVSQLLEEGALLAADE